MRLHLVPANHGVQWIKQGIATFRKQPLALLGLFLLFSLLVQILSSVPAVGIALALGLLPAATLGFMSATREVAQGRFPMPGVLLSAFRTGRQRLQAMLLLGLLYALAFGLSMGLTWLIDGGEFIRVFLQGEPLKQDDMLKLMQTPAFQLSVFTASTCNVVLAMLFWHAPALVHWHEVPPVKSLFFSLMACVRNFKAFFVYSAGWMLLTVLVLLVVSMLAGALGGAAAQMVLQMGIMVVTAMFFTSQYFTFVDCFMEADPQAGPPQEQR